MGGCTAWATAFRVPTQHGCLTAGQVATWVPDCWTPGSWVSEASDRSVMALQRLVAPLSPKDTLCGRRRTSRHTSWVGLTAGCAQLPARAERLAGDAGTTRLRCGCRCDSWLSPMYSSCLQGLSTWLAGAAAPPKNMPTRRLRCGCPPA